MERRIFLLSICIFAFLVHSINAGKKIASVDEDYIRAFRAKSYVEPVDELQDLDSNSTEVIGVLDKIKELETKGFDLLNTVPDNGATCSVQVKFYITAIIDRAKEQCDYCVLKSVNKLNSADLNDDQKNCSLDAIGRAQNELEKLSASVEHRKLVS